MTTERPSDHLETSSEEPTSDIQRPARESRRRVVVDVLATAIVDLLLKDRLHVRGDHEDTTC
jgi:hypothetical protein